MQVGSRGRSPAYINCPEIELVTMARRFYACMENMTPNGTITGKDILPRVLSLLRVKEHEINSVVKQNNMDV